MWVEALRLATPHSPRPGRKDPPQTTTTNAGEENRPKYTQRQETVDVAAKVASEATSNGHVEEVSHSPLYITLL